MTRPHYLCLIAVLLCFAVYASAQEKSFDTLDGAEVRVYKTVDGYDLKLSIIYPQEVKKRKKSPAIIFFFGGGWANGTVQQFAHQCQYLASKGMVAVTANYRVKSRNNSTPFDGVEDAKSAMRYLKAHAKELRINKKKIVASGGSAGGHLAACTAMVPGFDAADENHKISTRPSALILFNPAVNMVALGRVRERLGEKAELISPAHHITTKLPPTLIFHGEDDQVVPFGHITDFQKKMEAAGNTCYVVPFQGMGHGFFNYGKNNNRCYELTLEKTEAFLRELKYIR